MPTASAFGMEGVDRAALESGERRFDETRLVERVGMDRHLHVHLVGYGQAIVDRRRRRSPVFVQLEADGAGAHLFAQRFGQRDIALAEKAEIHRKGIGRFEHALNVPRARRAGSRVGAGGRPGAAAEHRGHPRHQRFVDLLRADEVDVAVDTAGGDDHPFAGDDLGAAADADRHAGLDVRIAGLADAGNGAALDGDIGLDDSPVVDDQRIGDHRVRHFGSELLALPHAVADDLAAAELDLLAVDREIVLDGDPQLGIGEANAIADGRAEHLGVGLTRNPHAHCSVPITRPLKP